MTEKITLKNALANLPQKTDVDSIVATDASGNPVYIKKSDLAQVVAELIGTASKSKDGLMSSTDYSNNSITVGNSGSTTDKIFEIKNYNAEKCLVTFLSRDNNNNMGSSIIAFNGKTHYVLVKSDFNYYNFYYMEENPRRYFVSPMTTYGSVEMRFMNGRGKIEIIDVSESVIYTELTKIV